MVSLRGSISQGGLSEQSRWAAGYGRRAAHMTAARLPIV
jgi:hypothetical protein